MTAAQLQAIEWPTFVRYSWKRAPFKNLRYYEFAEYPGSQFVGVTTVLDPVLGFGKEGLMRWGVGIERAAGLEAIARVHKPAMGTSALVVAVNAAMKGTRADVEAKEKAGDIGTAAHDKIHWWLRRELGIPTDAEPEVGDASEWAFMSAQDWFRASKLKPLLMEQPVVIPSEGVAGTFDLWAEDPELGPGLIDYKSSKYVYESHHIQVAQYCHMLKTAGIPIQWAKIVRIPKDGKRPDVEVVNLGDCYGGRKVSEADLVTGFRAALFLYRKFVEPAE